MTIAPDAPAQAHHAHARRHPALKARDELTVGQRAADHMRNILGSWAFVFGFLAAMALWMGANSWLLLGRHGKAFDPFPWVLENLMLSLLAGLQGAILLIAAKRQDQISSDLAHHDYETNLETKAVTDAIHALTVEVHKAVVTVQAAADKVGDQ